MKSKIYSTIIETVIIFLYTTATPQVSTDDKYITTPCASYNVGSYRIYTYTSENKLSVFKNYVVSNENGIIKILSKFYLDGKDQEQPSSITTEILSEKDGVITTLKHESASFATIYLKPYPICGLLPKEVKSITVTKMNLGNSEKVDTTVTISTLRFIGEEMVKVKAGEFKASVIESKSKHPNGSSTLINYYTQGIGVVKVIMISKTILPEQKIESTILQTITTMELIEYKINYQSPSINSGLQETINKSRPDQITRYDYVNDYSDKLNASEEEILNKKLTLFEGQSTIQIAVLLIPTIKPYFNNSNTFAEETFNRWGIGQKHKDNGLFLVIATEDKFVRITTGSGMESVFTDSICGKILDEKVMPSLRKGDHFNAILQCLDQFINFSINNISKLKAQWNARVNLRKH